MYEELVKRLRDDEAWKNCDFDFIYGWMHEAADAIEQLSNAGSAYGRGWTLGYDAGREESKPRWIPVTERLPEKSGSYLAYVYGEVTEMDCWRGKWHMLGDDYTKAVTHWMPLPEPPKEDEHG